METEIPTDAEFYELEEYPPPFTVVSIGDLVADVTLGVPVLPIQAGQDQMIDRMGLEPGGAGNFLIMGARLGLNMIALGVVGGDESFGAAVLNMLRYERVDVHLVHRQPGGGTTVVFVLVDAHGQHVFLGQHGLGKRIPFSGEWKQAILRADVVIGWGYTTREERIAGAFLEALHFAKENQRAVFFDPGPDMREAGDAYWKEVLTCSYALLLTEEEIPSFAKGEARRLLDYGPQMVCLKRGERGCILYTKDETVEHAGFHVPLRDTTAAGDAFAAGFVQAWLEKKPPLEIAAFANAVGAAKVQKFGSGRQVPTQEEVLQLLTAQK
jgi:ribokinase